jgi:DnaD/phage-associated family protein
MSKTILAKVDGFTPLIDGLVAEHGIVRAAVFGKVWRYCQMEDGVCRASQERMADELGLTRATVNKHIEALCADGYLIDKTPTLAGAPHVYADTGKAGVSISLTGKVQGVKQIDTPCINGLQVGVNEIDTKKEVKKEKESDDKDPEIFGMYQQNIGILTPVIAELLIEAEKKYSKDWIAEAFTIAVKNNVRKWKYVEAVLDGWERNGKDWTPGKNGKPKQPANTGDWKTL